MGKSKYLKQLNLPNNIKDKNLQPHSLVYQNSKFYYNTESKWIRISRDQINFTNFLILGATPCGLTLATTLVKKYKVLILESNVAKDIDIYFNLNTDKKALHNIKIFNDLTDINGHVYNLLDVFKSDIQTSSQNYNVKIKPYESIILNQIQPLRLIYGQSNNVIGISYIYNSMFYITLATHKVLSTLNLINHKLLNRNSNLISNESIKLNPYPNNHKHLILKYINYQPVHRALNQDLKVGMQVKVSNDCSLIAYDGPYYEPIKINDYDIKSPLMSPAVESENYLMSKIRHILDNPDYIKYDNQLDQFHNRYERLAYIQQHLNPNLSSIVYLDIVFTNTFDIAKLIQTISNQLVKSGYLLVNKVQNKWLIDILTSSSSNIDKFIANLEYGSTSNLVLPRNFAIIDESSIAKLDDLSLDLTSLACLRAYNMAKGL